MPGQRLNATIVGLRAADGGRFTQPVDVRVRPLYNPALRSPVFVVPGIIGMILSNILILITALSIVLGAEVNAVVERHRGERGDLGAGADVDDADTRA